MQCSICYKDLDEKDRFKFNCACKGTSKVLTCYDCADCYIKTFGNPRFILEKNSNFKLKDLQIECKVCGQVAVGCERFLQLIKRHKHKAHGFLLELLWSRFFMRYYLIITVFSFIIGALIVFLFVDPKCYCECH